MTAAGELKSEYEALCRKLGISGISSTDRARYYSSLCRKRRLSSDEQAAIRLALELEGEEVRWGARAALSRHPDPGATRLVLLMTRSALPGARGFGAHAGREILDAVRTLGSVGLALPLLHDEIIAALESLRERAAYPALDRSGGAHEAAPTLRAEADKALRRLVEPRTPGTSPIR